MKVWQVVVTLLFGYGAVPKDCIEVSSGTDALAGLDSALAATASLSAATLCLAPSAEPFELTAAVTIASEVTIHGQAQTITFIDKLEVRGSLAILNCTLTASLASITPSLFLLFGGSIHIEHSSVATAAAALIAGTGTVSLQDSHFYHNDAPAVHISRAGETTLSVLQCVVWNQTGEFLLISPLAEGSVSVSIEKSVFKESRGTGFLLSCAAPTVRGTFTVSNTEFIANIVPVVFFDIGDTQVAILNCRFVGNSQSTLTVNGRGAVLRIEDSMWSGNSHIVFNLWQFTGDLLVSRITVTDQRWQGIFQVKNNLSPELCRFTMRDSSFLNTRFKVKEASPGVLNASGCLILITGAVVDNVRMGSVHLRDVEGLVILRFGALAVARLTLRSSGTAGLGLGVAMGEFTLTDSFLHDLQSAASLYVGSTVGSLIVNNVNVTHGEIFPIDDKVTNAVAMYFSALSSHMQIRSLRVFPIATALYSSSNILYATFATLDVSGIYIQGLKIDAIGHLIDVKGTISNVTIVDCELVFSICYLNNFELVRVSGVAVRDSSIGLRFSTGLFAATPSLYLECLDFCVENVTAHYFVASKKALVSLRNIAITDCHFQYLLKYQVDSNVYIENMHVRKSTAVLAFLYRSSLRIVDSLFEDIASTSIIIGGATVNITLDRVVIKNTASPSGFARFQEKSQVTISHCAFSSYQSTSDEGFYHDTGALSITSSTFRSFNTVFIQAKGCSVYLGDSAFQGGRSKALSRTSASAYGGAFACTGCASVVVERSSFLNVSASFGGAVAVRSMGAVQARISNCEFEVCRATAGGAIYAEQSALFLDSSKFIGNEAASTGGAVNINTSKEYSARIRNCVFYRNSASEGGAVKWVGALVSFTNATFQDNSAVYGPDIASYGIALLGRVTGTAASGYPLQLVIELQDHYGQRVTTASSQYFQLSPSANVGFLGNTAATIDRGIFNFSQLVIYAQPNSHQSITGVMVEVQSRDVVMIETSVNVTFRDCLSGEVRKADRCEYCFAGSVSFHPSEKNCSICPKHAFCPGGNALIVDSSYWRNSTNSTGIVQCPLRANCLGGRSSECAEGYTGQMCNECSEDYTRLRTLQCEPCTPHFLQWIKVVLIIAPILVFYTAVNSASGHQYFMLKQVINHAQLISTLSFLRVSYPAAIKYSLHSLSYVSSLLIPDLPLSCFHSTSPEQIKALIGSAMPTLLCLLLMFLKKSNMKQACVLCTSALMFTPVISLSSQLPLLACQPVPSGEQHLFLDLQQKCWEGGHALLVKALILPSVIVNVLLPFLLVLTVSLTAPAKFDEFFPLWRSGVNWRWWDLLLYCAKVLLTSLFTASIPARQLSTVAYALLTLIAVSVTQAGAGARAYTHWKLFSLVECSLVLVGVTIYLCAFFIYNLPTQEVSHWIITAFFLLLNAGYFAACIQLWRLPSTLIEETQPPVSSCQVNVPPNSAESFSLSQDQP